MTLHSSNTVSTSRRTFLMAGAGATAASLVPYAGRSARASENDTSSTSLIQPGQTILFQGDSITDAARDRKDMAANSPAGLGIGYAWLTAAQLLVSRPNDNLKIYNRGIGGDKVFQLVDRWQTDCLDLKPDVLSILVGVNDYWQLRVGDYHGTVEDSETSYRKLMQLTRAALPNVKIIIGEPYAIKHGPVDDSWFPAFDAYREVARKIADEADAIFIPYQSLLESATKVAPVERWVSDGVHLTNDGATLFAHWWLKAVGA